MSSSRTSSTRCARTAELCAPRRRARARRSPSSPPEHRLLALPLSPAVAALAPRLPLRCPAGRRLVECGFDHTVAVTGDMRARAWGRAHEGQLGIEAEHAQLESPRGGGCVLAPTLAGLCEGDSPAAIQAVAAGGMHTLLLTAPRSKRDDPVVFACGRGQEGQLGTGPDGLAASCNVASAVDVPTQLPTVVVAAGGLHSAALSSHGHVFVWGDGGFGQLGLPKPQRPPPPPPGGAGGGAPPPPLLSAPPAVSVPHVLASAAFEGRAELEKKVPIQVSAAEVSGKTFTVLGRRNPPLQARMQCPPPRRACVTSCLASLHMHATSCLSSPRMHTASPLRPCMLPLA